MKVKVEKQGLQVIDEFGNNIVRIVDIYQEDGKYVVINEFGGNITKIVTIVKE